MSKVMTASTFVGLLDKWGIKHRTLHANWATHNREGHGAFGDMNGVMIHHTGALNSVASMRDTLWNGYAGLPGPLCHGGIEPDGTVCLIGWGRANHAGLGDGDILNLVKASKLPHDKSLMPGKADTDGNAHFYGFEFMYDGKSPMSEAQRVAGVRVSAAICTYHDWKADVIGHGEWQQGKWDPGAHGKLINMGTWRTWVDQAMKEGPTKLPTRPKPPSTQKPSGTGSEITVVAGDTLMGIAEKVFHDPKRWVDIVAANPQLLKPLVPGQKLVRPGK